ncbi:nucleotide exchange factor GrpE [Candidatus Kaiserbacteria bacterium]|nr:nucleotide exchange factor GrpE [Candidatus Kaiserbacteria bacterium]
MSRKKNAKIDKDEEIIHTVGDDFVPEDDIAGASEKLKKIQKKLKECEKERQEYLDGWQRARADLVNRERDVGVEKEHAITRAQESIFIKLLPILDSFDMAFSHKEAWEKIDQNWRAGIEQIYAQAVRVFREAGIAVIDESGVPFDAHLHEPIETETVSDRKKDWYVLKVVQKGYRKGTHVLRAARVIIGKFNA